MWGRGSIPQSPGDGDIPSFGGSVFPGRDFHKRFFVYTFSNPVLRQEGVRGSVGGVAFPELGHKALAQTSPRRVRRASHVRVLRRSQGQTIPGPSGSGGGAVCKLRSLKRD